MNRPCLSLVDVFQFPEYCLTFVNIVEPVVGSTCWLTCDRTRKGGKRVVLVAYSKMDVVMRVAGFSFFHYISRIPILM